MGFHQAGRRRLAGLSAAGLVVLASCGSPGPAADGRIRVVAGANFWGNIAAQIGGNRAEVTSIIRDPNTDPHDYEADVHTAAALAGARVVIENGLGYDDFLRKLLSASPARHRTVLVAADAVGVTGRSANPHLWYGPRYAVTVARAIESALARADPADARTFRANLARFLAGEQRVVRIVDRIKAKYAGTEVAYTERVPGYLLAAAGLRLGTPASFSQSVEDGNDPGPADAAAFDEALTGRAVKVLIYNAQVTDAATKHLRDVARTAGIPVVGMTETLPAAEHDYQTWQAEQAGALLAALGG
jgi:zinc/manganese transport system substrate-binding protein